MGKLSFHDLEAASARLEVVTPQGQRWSVELHGGTATLSALAGESGTVEFSAAGRVHRAEVGPEGAGPLPPVCVLPEKAQRRVEVEHVVVEHGIALEMIDSIRCLCGEFVPDEEWDGHIAGRERSHVG